MQLPYSHQYTLGKILPSVTIQLIAEFSLCFVTAALMTKHLSLRKELPHLLGNTDFQHSKRGRIVSTPLRGQLFGQNEYIQNMKNTMRFNR